VGCIFVQRYDFSEFIDQANLAAAVSCTVLDHLFVNMDLDMCKTKEIEIYSYFLYVVLIVSHLTFREELEGQLVHLKIYREISHCFLGQCF
jgi:hypothetical protein